MGLLHESGAGGYSTNWKTTRWNVPYECEMKWRAVSVHYLNLIVISPIISFAALALFARPHNEVRTFEVHRTTQALGGWFSTDRNWKYAWQSTRHIPHINDVWCATLHACKEASFGSCASTFEASKASIIPHNAEWVFFSLRVNFITYA